MFLLCVCVGGALKTPLSLEGPAMQGPNLFAMTMEHVVH